MTAAEISASSDSSLLLEQDVLNMTPRHTIEGWVEQASNQLDIAKTQLKNHRTAETIQASQVCIELSVKAVLSLLEISYSPSHEWKHDGKEFGAIANQIRGRGLLGKLETHGLGRTVPLPRLLLVMNFWARLYIPSKYGFEAEHLASASELFKVGDAALSVQHAEECFNAAWAMRYMDKERTLSLLARDAA